HPGGGIEMPALGDRVAHEHHALLARRRRAQRYVRFFQTRQPWKVSEQLLIVLTPVVVIGMLLRNLRRRRCFLLRYIARLLCRLSKRRLSQNKNGTSNSNHRNGKAQRD